MGGGFRETSHEQVWWSRGWVPFAEDGCGNMFCIDLDPGPSGTKGQVINMEVQDGMGPFPTAHESVLAFVKDHLALLRADKVLVTDGWLEVDRYA